MKSLDGAGPVTADEIDNNWTNGRPFLATSEHCKFRWNCGKPGEGFRCALCGHKFIMGDTVRWQFTNDTPGAAGNPFVCKECDTGRDGIINEIIKRRSELKEGRFWWFLQKDRA